MFTIKRVDDMTMMTPAPIDHPFIDITGLTLDSDTLLLELQAVGIAVSGLAISGTELRMYDAEGAPIPPTPETEAVVEAHDASKPKRASLFEEQEDAERLALVNQRAQVDPAFAALSELVLRPKG